MREILTSDGGGDSTPIRQSPAPVPALASISSFKQKEYLDYRTGERQTSVVDEQTKIAGKRAADAAAEAMKRAAEDDELARDKAAARQAQIDAADAMTKARLDLLRAQEAKAAAEEAARKAAEEAARKAAEDEERRKQEEENNNNNYNYNPSTVSNTTPYVPVSPTPLTPSNIGSKPSNISPVTQTPPPPPVKTAPIDTILFNEEAVPIQIMSDLIFENIGGQELINIARNDTVNGQNIIYQPIKNLTSIQQEYNPNNIVALQATSDKYFQNFSIKFENKVPQVGSGPNGEHVYIDSTNGSLVIELVNLDSDEQVEMEITTSGTIYEAEL
jgi:hypothetical protein